jgi:hypothetical protein
MARGGKRPGAGRPRKNIEYTSIQIPTDVYKKLKEDKGPLTWKEYFTDLLNLTQGRRNKHPKSWQ